MEQSQKLYEAGLAVRQNAMTIDQLTEMVATMVIGASADRKTPINLFKKEGHEYLLARINEAYKLVLGDLEAGANQQQKAQEQYAKALNLPQRERAAKYQNN